MNQACFKIGPNKKAKKLNISTSYLSISMLNCVSLFSVLFNYNHYAFQKYLSWCIWSHSATGKFAGAENDGHAVYRCLRELTQSVEEPCESLFICQSMQTKDWQKRKHFSWSAIQGQQLMSFPVHRRILISNLCWR